ncbi:N-acetylmannosamine-6-phosphate 2-epimerase [Anaerorhabdus sp.]|uniref:N-acetylmannosamine-6-phosphate 2-epimerase n=1 Tax=Anaerorhabdus sp. TaxID=1872524 RepID=UPI002FC708B2
MKNKKEILDQLRGGIIVSCQIEKHAPCYSEDIVELMVKSALWGGACGLRINGEENIRNTRKITELPIIGLIKIFRDDTEVFMTPSMEEVKRVIEAGADIVAIDGTDRLIDGHVANQIISEIRKEYPDTLIFADVRDEVDAIQSIELGADIVAPTFYRFKKDAKSTDTPDWEMFSKLCDSCCGKGMVMMEGKVWTPDDAIKAFHYGADAVVVGSAITRPHLITQRFCDHVNGFKKKRSLIY